MWWLGRYLEIVALQGYRNLAGLLQVRSLECNSVGAEQTTGNMLCTGRTQSGDGSKRVACSTVKVGLRDLEPAILIQHLLCGAVCDGIATLVSAG